MIQTESILSGEKINVTDILKFVLEWVKNILGNGDNAGDQHFVLFPTMLSKGLFLRVI